MTQKFEVSYVLHGKVIRRAFNSRTEAESFVSSRRDRREYVIKPIRGTK